jgi:hypothetical protein
MGFGYCGWVYMDEMGCRTHGGRDEICWISDKMVGCLGGFHLMMGGICFGDVVGSQNVCCRWNLGLFFSLVC